MPRIHLHPKEIKVLYVALAAARMDKGVLGRKLLNVINRVERLKKVKKKK